MVEDGYIPRGNRAVIPAKYQAVVLSELHLNHPGMITMRSPARLHVWWPSLDHGVVQTVQDCHLCRENSCKTPQKLKSAILGSVPHDLGREYMSTSQVR